MRTQRHRRGALIPVIVAAFIALVGQAVILCNDFSPENDLQANESTRMITAAALSRAGAVEIPTEPPVGRPIA
jgi:hypothetical protein